MRPYVAARVDRTPSNAESTNPAVVWHDRTGPGPSEGQGGDGVDVSRTRRILRITAVLLALAVVIAAVVAVEAVRRPWPQTDGTLRVDAFDAPVDVYRDAFGVAHVYADTSDDLFAAQGFVHAQDRFWEMDVRRHTTAGRLSELFGESQVDTDRVIRTMGWRRVAEQELALLRPESIRILEAYASGVNAYLEDRPTSEIALEYRVLGLQRPGYEPEPWSPADSLAWLKAMAWDLRSNIEHEFDRVAYTETLTRAQVEQLWPAFPFELRAPIVADGAVAAPKPSGDAQPAAAVDAGPGSAVDARTRHVLAQVSDRLDTVPDLLGPSGSGLGSNAMVVAGEHTATGLPLLANDPHLGPQQPSLWYQMALHCRTVSAACPYKVTGYSFSGLPGIVIGHNQRIAWGFTNLAPDVADHVLERVTGDTYEYAGDDLPLDVRRETIDVAGGEPVDLTVRSTRHGPLLSDALDSLSTVTERAPAGEGEPDLAVALRWTALRPGATFDALPALNAARDFDEFRAAAAQFEVPSQNLVYADVDGTIGYQAPGRIPVRADGDDGRWPVPGWTGEHDWQGHVPFDELPSIRDPAEGFIVTANQPVVAEGTGPFLSRDHAYGWRSQRLRELLTAADDLTADDLMAMQLDARNGVAFTLVPLLTRIAVPDDVAAARDLLVNWDQQQSVDSAAGAYFAAVWRNLLIRTFADDLPPDTVIDSGGRWMEVVRRFSTMPDAAWWDDRATDTVERRDDMLRAALVDAHTELVELLGDDVAGWSWGDVHTLTLRHQTLGSSGVAPIERLFNRGPVRLGGGSSLVNATGWTASDGYDVNWVPSMRMVVDLSNLDASRWIDLTGVSGHAFSPHYTDQVQRWAAGESIPMRWSRLAVTAAATGHLILRPGGAAP